HVELSHADESRGQPGVLRVGADAADVEFDIRLEAGRCSINPASDPLGVLYGAEADAIEGNRLARACGGRRQTKGGVIDHELAVLMNGRGKLFAVFFEIRWREEAGAHRIHLEVVSRAGQSSIGHYDRKRSRAREGGVRCLDVYLRGTDVINVGG